MQEAELAWRDVKPKMERYDGDFKLPLDVPAKRRKGRPAKYGGYDPYFDDMDTNYT